MFLIVKDSKTTLSNVDQDQSNLLTEIEEFKKKTKPKDFIFQLSPFESTVRKILSFKQMFKKLPKALASVHQQSR